jgi:hypothetical protein
MVLVVALITAAWLGGTAATYLFDDDEPLLGRLAVGGPLGLTLLGLAGFVVASFFGLGLVALAIGFVAAAAPLLALRDPARRFLLREDARALLLSPGRAKAALILFYGGMGVVVWRVCGRAVMAGSGGIGTGVDHNLGDLPFHIAIVARFLYGGNFPPEHPELAGVPLTYPFLVDFVAAMLMRAGASLRNALFSESFVLGLCLVALLHRWAVLLTRDRLASLVAPVLFLLSGGMGWTMLFRDVDPIAGGLVGLLSSLAHNYTILATGELRWGNVVTTLLVPQRTLLIGLPLALAVFTLWWEVVGEGAAPGNEDRARRRMAGAGVIGGLLPLVHGHSFAVVMGVGACLALLFPRRTWLWFFAPALALALPQALWMAAGTALRARSFVGWHLGWDHGQENVVLFWLRNTGLFVPLLLAAFVWRRDGRRIVPDRLARFYVPFALCFVVPNLLQLSPWVWDNIKFLVYWYVASVPIVALLLAHLWRKTGLWRVSAAAAFVLLTLAGALDVWRVVSRAELYGIFDAPAVDFGERLRDATPPDAVILYVPTYRSPVFLAGRRSVLGYPGHIWSQGLDGGTREADIGRIYRGGPDAPELLRRYGVDYVMFGPEEGALYDEGAWKAHSVVVSNRSYRLFDVRGQ